MVGRPEDPRRPGWRDYTWDVALVLLFLFVGLLGVVAVAALAWLLTP